MPLYEFRGNAENRIDIPRAIARQIVVGPKAVADTILAALSRERRRKGCGMTVALDGWYGVDWKQIVKLLTKSAAKSGTTLVFEMWAKHIGVEPVSLSVSLSETWVTILPSVGIPLDGGDIQPYTLELAISPTEELGERAFSIEFYEE